ncbi:MAG TPA: translocase, partial [Fuerstia sp.]|nr:translocase [Fuerstiella sp.]
MTGTAIPAKRELKKTYKLKVTRVPTNKRCVRKGLPVRTFKGQAAKRVAISDAVQKLIRAGRSVLVGTPSVEASEALAEVFTQHGIQSQILNARYHEQEAEIVKQAGQPGKVTIATNMAGRGTDVILDSAVCKAG